MFIEIFRKLRQDSFRVFSVKSILNGYLICTSDLLSSFVIDMPSLCHSRKKVDDDYVNLSFQVRVENVLLCSQTQLSFIITRMD